MMSHLGRNDLLDIQFNQLQLYDVANAWQNNGQLNLDNN